MRQVGAGSLLAFSLILIVVGALLVSGLLDFLLRIIGIVLIVGGGAALIMGFLKIFGGKKRSYSDF